MLRIHLKTTKNIEIFEIYTLRSLFKEFFNKIYIDLNNLLSDYHSIQEHSNRIKIIDFIIKTKKNIEFLQIFVRGAFLLKELFLIISKGEECNILGGKIVEMANYLSNVFLEMRTGFMPKPNINLGIKLARNYRLIMPNNYRCTIFKENIPTLPVTSDINFEKIHRLMRILLLKENIKNYTIERGVLYVKFEYFEFRFILSTLPSNPQWNLLDVKYYIENHRIEDMILKKFGSSLKKLTEFAILFERHKKSQIIFENCSEISGFYKKFTGKFQNIDVRAEIDKKEFRCTLNKGKYREDFIDPSLVQLKEGCKEFMVSNKYNIIEKTDLKFRCFKKDVFGDNIAYFIDKLFCCFCKEIPVCFIGENTQFGYESAVKYSIAFSNDQYFFSKTMIDGGRIQSIEKHVKSVNNFIEVNSSIILLLYNTKDLDYNIKIGEDLKISFNNNHMLSVENHSANVMEMIIRRFYLRFFQLNKFIVVDDQENNLKLCYEDIDINVSDKLTTNYKYLNEDISIFNINSGIDYICNFSGFYKFNILPLLVYKDRIKIDFSEVLNEIITVIKEDKGYKIIGPNTLKLLGTPSTFNVDNQKTFQLLYKLLLCNRFKVIQKMVGSNNNIDSGFLILRNNAKISIGDNGLKYEGKDSNISLEITRILNTERDFLRYLKEII